MEMKAAEVSAEQQMRDIVAMAAALDVMRRRGNEKLGMLNHFLQGHMDAILSLFPSMTEELSHKRAAQIDEVCSCSACFWLVKSHSLLEPPAAHDK